MALLQVEDLSKSFTDTMSLFGASQFNAVERISFRLDKNRH